MFEESSKKDRSQPYVREKPIGINRQEGRRIHFHGLQTQMRQAHRHENGTMPLRGQSGLERDRL